MEVAVTKIPVQNPHLNSGFRSKKRKELMLDDEVLDISRFECRQYVTWRNVLYWIGSVLSVGLLPLIAQWSWCRRPAARLRTRQCLDNEADFAIIENADGTFEICDVEPFGEQANELLSFVEAQERTARVASLSRSATMIVYRHSRFIYNAQANVYQHVSMEQYTAPETCGNEMNGLSASAVSDRAARAGCNIIEIPIPAGWILFFKECMHPFFMFQVWAIIVWCTEEYYTYSVFIFVTAVLSAFVNFWDVRKNLLQLQRLARFSTQCTVLRDGQRVVVSSDKLVAGDVLVVENEMKLPCDCVLIKGQCSVNESMLTGETTVVMKSPLGVERVNAADARNTLFGGSQIAQLRVNRGGDVLAVVARTGFESVKGRLILSIMYPRAPTFKFFEQSLIFVLVLFLAAMIGFGLNVKALSDYETPVDEIIQRGCDMITIVVPPALPLALTVGVAFALFHLRRRQIFCISPPRITLAGKVNCFCFDKTGTLTTEGLELKNVRQAYNGAFLPDAVYVDALSNEFAALLASCHSLTHVGTKLVGDPLELQTFNFTGATLSEPHLQQAGSSLALQEHESHVSLPAPAHSQKVPGYRTNAFNGVIIHQYEFSAALQRMGVLARSEDGRVLSFVKGSPEMIKRLSVANSVPADFDKVLSEYTRKGLRVIAAGWKEFDVPAGVALESLRDQAEAGLNFLGFIVLENKLKTQTVPTIMRLRDEAGLQMHMVTGDNVIAAVVVARECQLIERNTYVYVGDVVVGSDGTERLTWVEASDETGVNVCDPKTLLPSRQNVRGKYTLAVTGAAFHFLQMQSARLGTNLLQKVCMNCTVFARMSPDHKATLVEVLQACGLYVGMIGDGANDSGALRAAHVGISLSQVEASVSAPLTSMINDISCVPLVLSEGRGSLSTSFCLFQFMCLYSTIQFANALLIVFMASYLSNNMYLYQDLWIVFLLALTMGYTPSNPTLSKKRPTGRLLSGYNLVLCFGFIALTFGLQGWVYGLVKEQPWYNTPEYPNAMNSDDDEEETNSRIPETTAVFKMSMLQYMAVSLIFSVGHPFKKPTYYNWMFSAWWIVTTAVSIWIFVEQREDVYAFLSMQVLPQSWNMDLFGYSWVSFFCYFAYAGLLYLAKSYGFFRWCNQVLCRARPKPHKLLKEEWKREMASLESAKSPILALENPLRVT